MVLKGKSQKRGWHDEFDEEEAPTTVRSAAEPPLQPPRNASFQSSNSASWGVGEATSAMCKARHARQGTVHDTDAHIVVPSSSGCDSPKVSVAIPFLHVYFIVMISRKRVASVLVHAVRSSKGER